MSKVDKDEKKVNDKWNMDSHKLFWHLDRVEKWQKGERIAPITIDMALTRACNYSCGFCYAMFQENDRKVITKKVIFDFLEDCAEIGVKGISFVSDGESTISPVFTDACKYGHELGLSMAVGTNAFVLTKNKLEEVLPYLTYLRINFSAGEKKDMQKSWVLKIILLIEFVRILKTWLN